MWVLNKTLLTVDIGDFFNHELALLSWNLAHKTCWEYLVMFSSALLAPRREADHFLENHMGVCLTRLTLFFKAVADQGEGSVPGLQSEFSGHVF